MTAVVPGASFIASRRFTACTWNVCRTTELPTLEPVLEMLLAKHSVSLFLLQEATQPGLVSMLRRHFLATFRYDQYVVAWDTEHWTRVNQAAVRLSQTPWFGHGGHVPRFSDSAAAILADRSGRTLTALSYHTPPHVQVAPSKRPQRRVEALQESMASLQLLAARSNTDACLFGGDDNVDERRAFSSFWDFMRERSTGLRQVRAPRPTHGSKRKIDDFRVTGLTPRAGEVVPGGGDHRVHIRTFLWD